MELPEGGLLDDPWRGPNAKLLAIRIPDTLYAALEEAAEEENISLPLLVRGALYFQFFPSVLKYNLNSLGVQHEGEEALEELKAFKVQLDDNRERLEKLLASYKTLRRGEAFALELEEKLQQLEKEFAQAWKYFAEQVKGEDKHTLIEELEAYMMGLEQKERRKTSKQKKRRKEKTA